MSKGKAVSVEVRAAAVEAYRRGEGSMEEISVRLGFGQATVRRWLARMRQGHGLAPRPHGGGRRPMLDEEAKHIIAELLLSNPQTPLEDFLSEVQRQTGVSPSLPTLRRALARLRIGRRRAVAVEDAASAAPAPPASESAQDQPASASRRDGYRDEHRRAPAAGVYPGSLTDAEWQLLEPLFEREGGAGRPEQYPRRAVLDAICYVVRAGGAWRMLPHDMPPWQTVYATFRRWAAAGLFEEMHDRLRRMWRERQGRKPEPTAGIVDSQSVKTTEKGGLEDTTAARR